VRGPDEALVEWVVRHQQTRVGEAGKRRMDMHCGAQSNRWKM
jgi:hypothetical protein